MKLFLCFFIVFAVSSALNFDFFKFLDKQITADDLKTLSVQNTTKNSNDSNSSSHNNAAKSGNSTEKSNKTNENSANTTIVSTNNSNTTTSSENQLDFDGLKDQIAKMHESIDNELKVQRLEEAAKEAEQEKKEFEEKIKDQLSKGMEIQASATKALGEMQQMKSDVKRLMKLVKTLLKSSEDLDSRVFALEKDIYKEKALRSSSSSSSQATSDSSSAYVEPKCSTKTQCSPCVAASSCGWCLSTKQCVEGDSIGPRQGSCAFYNYGKCSESGCNGYKDCSSCLVSSECGWCEGSALCMEGGRDGPIETCSSGYLHKDLFSSCKSSENNPLLTLEKELQEQSVN